MVSARNCIIEAVKGYLQNRAQRLTASMVSALLFSIVQRNKPLVLNALRHQWFRHLDGLGTVGIEYQCSTPYGINGFGTEVTKCGKLKAVVLVLNALRHQWFRHAQRLTASMVSAQRLTSALSSTEK